MGTQFENYKKLIKSDSKKFKTLLEDLNDKNEKLNISKKRLERIREFYYNLTLDIENDISKNKNLFNRYQTVMQDRKERGISEMNKLFKNFYNPSKIKSILQDIIIILDKKDEVKDSKRKLNTLLKTEKNKQFTRIRIWSSFRLEEKLNKTYNRDANRLELIKGMIAGFYSSLPSSYCWVHESNLGTFDISFPDSGELKKITTLVYNTTTSYEKTEKAGFFIEHCESGLEDCSFFCSSSDCNSPENFSLRKFELINFVLDHPCRAKFIKNGTLCYPSCEKIGMVTCEVGICSFSQDGCDLKQASMSKEMVESFVDFLGHIYSLKFQTPFGMD
jgi:hypothetical protein